MTWRQTGLAILFSPLFIGMLLCVAVLIVWKLPRVICERLRAVRWLTLVGTCYYGIVLTAAAWLLDLVWWQVLLLAVFAVAGGEWLLPDPVSFFVSPTRRRAVLRAVEFVEGQAGPRALYGMVAVVGAEAGRDIVSVAIDTGCTPPGCRFLAVDRDGTVEELDFEYVAEAYGVRPWF